MIPRLTASASIGTEDTMATTTQTNKEIVQRGFDALNNRDRAAFRDLHADDAVIHVFGEDYYGIDDIIDNQFGFVEAFSDLTYTPETIFAEDELVGARWTATGTHDGEYEGIEPTGEETELPVMGQFRVEDGLVVEAWIEADQLRLLQQLGVVEPPGE